MTISCQPPWQTPRFAASAVTTMPSTLQGFTTLCDLATVAWISKRDLDSLEQGIPVTAHGATSLLSESRRACCGEGYAPEGIALRHEGQEWSTGPRQAVAYADPTLFHQEPLIPDSYQEQLIELDS